MFGSIKSVAMGTGIGLLQVNTKVNVEYPFQMRQPTERSFDLEIDKLVFSGRNSSFMYMNVCFRSVNFSSGK